MKAISVRFADEMLADLDRIARVSAVTPSEVVREAVHRHISLLHTDERFHARLREQIEKDREALERLAG
jgi:predicted transcriptional regulator